MRCAQHAPRSHERQWKRLEVLASNFILHCTRTNSTGFLAWRAATGLRLRRSTWPNIWQKIIDYRAISGLDAPVASPHSSEGSYTPPDPRLVEQVEMVNSGASTPNRAFPGEEDFSVVSVEQEPLLLRQPYAAWMPSRQQKPYYILDASWQDFVAQLGFWESIYCLF
jgi:hypothetical protein